jgi:hypothetical protein
LYDIGGKNFSRCINNFNEIVDKNSKLIYTIFSNTIYKQLMERSFKMKSIFKKLTAITLASICSIGLAMPAAAASNQWRKAENGWWYSHTDGSYTKNGWENIEEKWYYFDASGYMKTGWQFWNGNWYYLEQSGEMATGWKFIDEKWYYLDPTRGGAMATGFLTLGEDIYYLESNGEMRVEPLEKDGCYYLFDLSGKVISKIQKGQFHYDCPENWNLIVDMGNFVLLMPDSMDGSNIILIGLDMEQKFGEFSSLTEIQQTIKKEMKTMLEENLGGTIDNMIITSRKLSGTMTPDALDFEITYNMDDLKMRSSLCLLFFDDKFIEVCYTASADKFFSHQTEFKDFVTTIAPGNLVQN